MDNNTPIEEYNEFQPKWLMYFFELAKTVAKQSKDPSTKVGAVIITKDKRIISTGYNGFPVGADDNTEMYLDKPTKYKRVVHAEANAITQAARYGVPLNDCIMFVTLPPCIECAKLIIQSGIKHVYYLPDPSKEQTTKSSDVYVSVNVFEMFCADIDTLVTNSAIGDDPNQDAVVKTTDKLSGMTNYKFKKNCIKSLFANHNESVAVLAVACAINKYYEQVIDDNPFAIDEEVLSPDNITPEIQMLSNSVTGLCEITDNEATVNESEDNNWRDLIGESVALLTECGVRTVSCTL